MEDEIKEILDKPKILMLSYGSYISLNDYVKLKDYITNLKEEINKLTAESTEWESKFYDMQDNFHNANEEIERLKEENKRLRELDENYPIEEQLEEALKYENIYKSRIDKAIELLKEAGCYDEEAKTFCDDIWEELPKLLNILQGE